MKEVSARNASQADVNSPLLGLRGGRVGIPTGALGLERAGAVNKLWQTDLPPKKRTLIEP